jgi:hypothetical protein
VLVTRRQNLKNDFEVVCIPYIANNSYALNGRSIWRSTFDCAPAPLPGLTANSLVITGNVIIDRLTLNVNFSLATESALLSIREQPR